MKVSIYDVICELNRRKITVNNLSNLTDEALIKLLPEVETLLQQGNYTGSIKNGG